jgi:hypothetical protein
MQRVRVASSYLSLAAAGGWEGGASGSNPFSELLHVGL